MSKMLNYDYGTKPKEGRSVAIQYFPYFASDIIKALYVFRDRDVTVKQYDIVNVKYVYDLSMHLGLSM